jgi:hypothetical protein
MNKVANIVETLRYGGNVDSSQLNDLATVSVAQPSIEKWQMNFEGGTLSESCEITSKQPIIGAGLLAYSADGVTFYFGTYCSMSDAEDKTNDTIALPTGSTSLFNPDTNGRNVMGIVYGEVLGPDGKLIPFSQQRTFTV